MGLGEEDHGLKYYLCGGVAGGVASIPTTPLDVIKTKLNTQNCESSTCEKAVLCNILRKADCTTPEDPLSRRTTLWLQNGKSMSTMRESGRYRNILSTVRSIWAEEGARGFFRGVQMRMAIQSVSSGIGWGTYQLVKGMVSKSQY